MADEPARLAGGLAKAIKAERDGHSFYAMAANASADSKAKEVFAQLAAEELDHMHFLTRHYESVLKTGKPDQAAKLGPRADLSGLSPIFSDGIKARIKDAHYEMSALSIGVQLEAAAMTFYQAEEEAAHAPDVKQFYSELAGWEAGHYRALLQQQEELKED